jgi:hypothetical protein
VKLVTKQGSMVRVIVLMEVTTVFRVAVTVTACKPIVAGLLVQIEMRPLAAAIVNSEAEILATPLAGVLEIAKVIGPQNPGMLYATLIPSRIVGAC